MDSTTTTFEQDFSKALQYANRVVFSFTNDPVEAQDLVQEFSVEVLSRKEKYAEILKHKATVYNILKSKFFNAQRKIKEYAFSDHFPNHSDESNYGEALTRNNQSSIDDLSVCSSSDPDYGQQAEYLESILLRLIQPNGRKGAVHSYKAQQELIGKFNQSNKTTRAFCKEHGISTATLHKLLKNGPKKVPVPKSIEQFKMYKLQGKSLEDVAKHFGVSKGSVSQNVSHLKKLITRYFEENDFYGSQHYEKEPFQY